MEAPGFIDSPFFNTTLSFVLPVVMVYAGVILGTFMPACTELNRLQRLLAGIPFAILVSDTEATGYLLAVHRFKFDPLISVSLYIVLIALWIRQGQTIGTGVLPKFTELMSRYFRVFFGWKSAVVARMLTWSESAQDQREGVEFSRRRNNQKSGTGSRVVRRQASQTRKSRKPGRNKQLQSS